MRMDSLLKLRDAEDRNRLIHILETSVAVRRPNQFFGWTQGPLQALLPHEIIICGVDDGPERGLWLQYFTASRYFREEHFQTACHPQHGFIVRVIAHWRATRQPCLVPAQANSPPVDPGWEQLLRRLELRDMVSHGQMGHRDNLQAWFGFFRVGAMHPCLPLLLEILLPVIAQTYYRAIVGERSTSAQAGRLCRVGSVLSCRELEVLQLLRTGHSNVEIAQQLRLSAMTAKNHVQNIRRKLKVRTRGQAVAEALRLGLITAEAGE